MVGSVAVGTPAALEAESDVRFEHGVTDIEFTVSDKAGNSDATCYVTVVVLKCLSELQAPTAPGASSFWCTCHLEFTHTTCCVLPNCPSQAHCTPTGW